MGNRQTSWQNKHRRRDSFVIEGRRPPWAKLPMWDGRAFKLCDEKFAGRNWEIFSQREAGTHGVGGRLGLQLYFDSSEIGRKDLCSQTPLQPSYPKRPVRHHHGVLTLGSLAIGDGTATDTNGFLATTSALLWGPTVGFTATGFRVTVAGSGSKAIGVIEKQRVA